MSKYSLAVFLDFDILYIIQDSLAVDVLCNMTVEINFRFQTLDNILLCPYRQSNSSMRDMKADPP